MSREIKFRGKRKDNGEWVHGYYFKTPLTDEATGSSPENGWSFLSGRERHCISKDGCVYEVIPETVGQHTGKKNIHATKFYEGDICESIDGRFLMVWDEDKAAFIMRFTDGEWLYLEEMWDESEVIGNVWENKDLLED